MWGDRACFLPHAEREKNLSHLERELELESSSAEMIGLFLLGRLS